MENAILTKGRYRNKTYGYVYENHPDYCRGVRQAAEANSYMPADEEFARFLISKFRGLRVVQRRAPTDEVCEQGSSHFMKAMTPAMRSEFQNLLGDPVIRERRVHPACQLPSTNGFLGVFYRYFIKKCVFNLRNEDGYNSYIDNYATIFPFEVSAKISAAGGDSDNKIYGILKTLKDSFEFRSRLRPFLNVHFDENVRLDEMLELFLFNVDRFQRETNMDIRHLENVLKNNESNRSVMMDGSGDRFDNFRRAVKQPSTTGNSYLDNFPRLNEEGANRYRALYENYEHIISIDNDQSSTRPPPLSYFTKLPERNFYELLSLLDVNFFRDHFETYTAWFQKYLFFFVGALRSDSKPIFFIDDVLFECLKSLQKFKKSRQDPVDLLTDLRMMTLVHRRKQGCDSRPSSASYAVDDEHLQHVKEYIETFPSIETARVEYEVPHRGLLECKALLVLDGIAIDVRFSKIKRGAIGEFFESFLMAGVCDEPNISEVVLYNAYAGIEYSVRLNERFDRAGIRDFIRRYNRWDFSVAIPPEKGLTWGWEQCFVEGTINWEEKRKYRRE